MLNLRLERLAVCGSYKKIGPNYTSSENLIILLPGRLDIRLEIAIIKFMEPKSEPCMVLAVIVIALDKAPLTLFHSVSS